MEIRAAENPIKTHGLRGQHHSPGGCRRRITAALFRVRAARPAAPPRRSRNDRRRAGRRARYRRARPPRTRCSAVPGPPDRRCRGRSGPDRSSRPPEVQVIAQRRREYRIGERTGEQGARRDAVQCGALFGRTARFGGIDERTSERAQIIVHRDIRPRGPQPVQQIDQQRRHRTQRVARRYRRAEQRQRVFRVRLRRERTVPRKSSSGTSVSASRPVMSAACPPCECPALAQTFPIRGSAAAPRARYRSWRAPPLPGLPCPDGHTQLHGVTPRRRHPQPQQHCGPDPHARLPPPFHPCCPRIMGPNLR